MRLRSKGLGVGAFVPPSAEMQQSNPGPANQFARSLGDVVSPAEGIGEKPCRLAQLIVQLAPGCLELEAHCLLICGAQVEVSVGVAADIEPLGNELAQLARIDPAGLVRQLTVPRRHGLRADKAGDDEERRRQAEFAQHRRGDLEVVAIAVIEGDREVPPMSLAAVQPATCSARGMTLKWSRKNSQNFSNLAELQLRPSSSGSHQ